ncbi:hypothetical protein HMPREF3027_07090 [Porphyromonas sp. HMSC077F02]|uniref:DUF4406 domain-containing protein n=1 Tax=Porphyromonas sp. HMSC077F02 TaxID=1739529 RepID=UPI0008B34786|nr:DUF4406 domain-containing protein [Porphyromonas sp. HMSC077F02]OFO52180.1 hypothetical protein HMPREF3027_07090 [Porphyromonas sp. HMSC077F02]
MINEKYLEKKLTDGLHSLGVWCEKYTNPFKAGYPDRLCITKGGNVFWVEVKTPGEKLRKLQMIRKAELKAIGSPVFVVDSEESLEEVLSFARQPRKQPKIYISGAISGRDYREVALDFEAAQTQIKAISDYLPISPLDNGLPLDTPWSAHMLRDLEILSTCDAMLMLPGWEHSPGCQIEKIFAERLGLRILMGLDELHAHAHETNRK